MRIAIAHPNRTSQLRDVISEAPEYDIAWIARDGLEAVTRSQVDPPDLLLMDLKMPVIDGVEATRRIMTHSPCPILLMASSVETNAALIFEAMGYGAKDVITDPLTERSPDPAQSHRALFKKLRTLYRLGQGEPPRPRARQSHPARSPVARAKPDLIVIGASTGGPGALGTVLSGLPANLQAALVIIQHVDQEFSFDLATWLDAQTDLPVNLAIQDSAPLPGHVYVASSNDHLVLTENHLFAYTAEPRASHYRPSVDVFFDSVARHWPRPGLAVLLTGMGRDGAKGLAALRRARWHTIAQDEASSVVYGMPKAARELDAAVDILPLSRIAETLLKRM